MVNANLLLSITGEVWLIEPSFIHSRKNVIEALLDGKLKNISFDKEQTGKPSAFIVSPTGAISFSSNAVGNIFQSAEPGSLAIIPVNGAIMKSDYCGTPGTSTLASIVKEAKANPNISGAIFKTDSPGGSVSGTQDFANAIKSFDKPKIGLVEDLAASAAYWFLSQMDEIYATGTAARIGSIGTMVSLDKKAGESTINIYAPDSSDKNFDFEEAIKGNTKPMQQSLAKINDVFKADVISGRGSKLNQAETLSGKVFMATEAQELGLIDGIKTFDEAVSRTLELIDIKNGSNQSINNNQNPQNNMKSKTSWGPLTAFLASVFPGFKAEETILTEEHFEKVNSELETLVQTKADLTTAKGAAEKASADLVSANETIASLNTEKETLTAEVARLGAINPGATNTAKEGTDVVESAKENEFYTSADADLAAAKNYLK